MTALRKRIDNRTQIRTLKAITHIGALIPLAVMIWDYTSNNLGPDIIRELTLRTGKTSLILLVMSLAVTPLITLINWKQLAPTRKLLGLYAFLYVALHLAIFVWLAAAYVLTRGGRSSHASRSKHRCQRKPTQRC